jgi:hypothetical protein
MRTRGATLVGVAVVAGIALWGPENLAAPPAPEAPSRSPVAPDLHASRGPALDPFAEVSGAMADLATRAPRGFALLPGAPGQPPRDWQLVSGKHWQILGPRGEDPVVTDAREGTRGPCPTGMVEVHGKMKMHFLLDELQLQACTTWIDRKWPERCAAYDRDKWLALSKDLPTQKIDVCMDRFEYPNRKGEWPVIMVSWYEARDACKADGKRLCTEDEWTFTCEGEEATPYPNGYARDPEACVNDRPWKEFHGEDLMPRATDRAMRELDRLWQGLPSGARPLCKSKAGVYDMTGNIDEWTRSSSPGERPSTLKGGYWGPVRTRCRPATKKHDEGHTFYQQGFRCCADVPPATTAQTSVRRP